MTKEEALNHLISTCGVDQSRIKVNDLETVGQVTKHKEYLILALSKALHNTGARVRRSKNFEDGTPIPDHFVLSFQGCVYFLPNIHWGVTDFAETLDQSSGLGIDFNERTLQAIKRLAGV